MAPKSYAAEIADLQAHIDAHHEKIARLDSALADALTQIRTLEAKIENAVMIMNVTLQGRNR